MTMTVEGMKKEVVELSHSIQEATYPYETCNHELYNPYALIRAIREFTNAIMILGLMEDPNMLPECDYDLMKNFLCHAIETRYYVEQFNKLKQEGS